MIDESSSFTRTPTLVIPLVPADTNVCVEVSDDLPIVTMNVFVVTSEITRSLPEAGSDYLG